MKRSHWKQTRYLRPKQFSVLCSHETQRNLKKIWEHKRCRDIIWLKAIYFEGCVFMASQTRHYHPLF